MIAGFGIKAGLVLLHVWLPLAHPAAPPTASAVLSGAMVKAGLVGWLRFLPLGEIGLVDAGRAMVIAGALGAFAAIPVGLAQRNPKTVLAYSTISQLGFLTIVVGVALAVPALAPACITAAVIYAVHHGLAKAAAFLTVPVWQHHGRRWRGRLVAAGTLIAGLAIVGAPFSSGAVGKYAAKNAVEGVVVAGFDLVDLLPWVATGSTLLLIRFWTRLQEMESAPAAAPDRELGAWLFLVAVCIPVPWILGDWWVPLAAVPELDPVTLWEATWPVLIGLAVAAVGWWQRPRL
ncbi:MAG: proton-conducting transporter membrane subunit, partial [Propionibacteriaceae bacterium]|nr:proton-conducting transporter membrane subunit [Propionibacteriaceae bacterium]